MPLVNGSAAITLIFTDVSTPTISTTYSGDANFNPSSATLTQTVTWPSYTIGVLGTGRVVGQINHAYDPLPILVPDWTGGPVPGCE